jgi:predicted ABC-type ATPase
VIRPGTKEFWIIAGLNGSGKSTFADKYDFPDGVKCLNPDTVSKRFQIGLCIVPVPLGGWFIPGQVAWSIPIGLGLWYIPLLRSAVRAIADLIAANFVLLVVWARLILRRTIAVETVLASSKYYRAVMWAKSRGYILNMVYVALPDVQKNIERVSIRVAGRGHNVREAKIRKRAPRSIDNLVLFAPLMDGLWVVDNSRRPAIPVIEKQPQQTLRVITPDRLQPIVARLLEAFPEAHKS